MSHRTHIFGDRAAITTAAVLLADQLTKWLAFELVEPGEEKYVIPGIALSQTRNEGIAFGLFAGRQWLVLLLMGVALAMLLVFYVRQRSRPVVWLATGMLMGGAIGNAFDRIWLGYVRDFLDPPAWPAFNIADVAITLGVVVLVFAVERNAVHDAARDHDD